MIDEADMLMEGSYKKEIDAILASFRRADRVQAGGAEGMDARERDGAGARRVNKTQYGETSVVYVCGGISVGASWLRSRLD